MKTLEQIEITLRHSAKDHTQVLYLDVYDHSLSRKWLDALNDILSRELHLEKNYCFLGFADSARDGRYIIDQINRSIACINAADLGYHINDRFTIENTIKFPERRLIHHKFNQLHRYFEDLQGVSGRLSEFYLRANAAARWHIRQLNLLCHEFECWALSYRKQIQAPDWQRPSQLMCWLNAPRFTLTEEDYQHFGIHTLNRDMGAVFVGVNKSVGKHHWEVYQDEGRDSRIGELVTSTLKTQTEAAGDFDIEWGQGTGGHPWHQNNIDGFVQWLIVNGFDPSDPALTIGHPQVGQIDLRRSFDTQDADKIWTVLSGFSDVYKIKTSAAQCIYDYHWSDPDYHQTQIEILGGNR